MSKLLLNGRAMPPIKKVTIGDDAAISTQRAIGGQLNVDRAYQKSQFAFEFGYLDIEDYLFIKSLYERHFSEGVFFQVQLTGTSYPINEMVFINPQSIVPRWDGAVLEEYTLTVTQR